MGYMHIDNLYKNQEILQFKEVYALEKIHGTSAHVSWKKEQLNLYPGGCKMVTFQSLFDLEDLTARFVKMGHAEVTLFGEQHGGKMQGMSPTYGKEARFTVFDVRVGDTWLAVENAESVAKKLGLEFVHYVKIPCTMEAIDEQRGADSVQAVRNGMGPGNKREGVVLRTLKEFTNNRGNRVMTKHKHKDFCETKTVRKVGDPKKQLEGEQAALEWATDMRLRHVVDKIYASTRTLDIRQAGDVIKAMLEDVEREGGEEVVMNKWTRTAICTATVKLYKKLLPELRKQYSLE